MPGMNLDNRLGHDFKAMFPITRELAEIGFPLRLIQFARTSAREEVYRVELDAEVPPFENPWPRPVDIHVSDMAMLEAAEPRNHILPVMFDQLFNRLVHEWKLGTALEVVRKLKQEVTDLKAVNVERSHLIEQLTSERDRANGIIDRILNAARGEDDQV